MKFMEINKAIPEIADAPHKMYVVEMNLDEVTHFKLDPKTLLRTHPPLADVDAKENITVLGVDGPWYSGDIPPPGIDKTHGIVLDFRPLGIFAIFWAKAPEAPRHQR